ncbi:hypothetical protein EON77_18585 [bacterium]|nr:MAG: hypothetical protein EON77_18585 [bacterium]
MRNGFVFGFVAAAAMTALGCSGGDASQTDEAQNESALEPTTGSTESAISSKERWCNSYKTERFCPKNVCAWYGDAAPYCRLPAAE